MLLNPNDILCNEKERFKVCESKGSINMNVTIPNQRRRIKPIHIIPFDEDAEEPILKRCRTLLSETEEDSAYALLALRSSIKPVGQVGQGFRCLNDVGKPYVISSMTKVEQRKDSEPFVRIMKPVASFERPLPLPPGLPRIPFGRTIAAISSSMLRGEKDTACTKRLENAINIQLL
jgi:hypothetical protein